MEFLLSLCNLYCCTDMGALIKGWTRLWRHNKHSELQHCPTRTRLKRTGFRFKLERRVYNLGYTTCFILKVTGIVAVAFFAQWSRGQKTPDTSPPLLIGLGSPRSVPGPSWFPFSRPDVEDRSLRIALSPPIREINISWVQNAWGKSPDMGRTPFHCRFHGSWGFQVSVENVTQQ